MRIEYKKWYSKSLGRVMEYKIYGDGGRSMLVFPSQDGRFYDYEDFGMIGVLTPWIERNELHVICCDSIDPETWSSHEGDPRHRIELQERWFRYIIDELIPSVRRDSETFITSGCSMGAFHAGNAFFRRPDIFDTLVALSGLYHAGYFFGGYTDELVYNNSPLDFLKWMPSDHHYWDIYRHRRIICCVGQGDWEEELLASTRRLDILLKERNVPAWVDYWGYDVAHDWQWWRQQLAYFMGKVLDGTFHPVDKDIPTAFTDGLGI